MSPVGALIAEVERREREHRSAVARARWTPERREQARQRSREAYIERVTPPTKRRLLAVMRDRAELDCLSYGRPYEWIADRERHANMEFYCPLFDDYFGIGVWGWRWRRR